MVTETITPIIAPLQRSDVTNTDASKDAFVASMETFNDAIPVLADELEAMRLQINDTETTMNALEASTVLASEVALSAANFQGTWVNQTTAVPQSWYYNGEVWGVLIPGNTSPVTSPSNWFLLSLSNQIHNATAETTPVDADEFGFLDSASSWIMKKMTWGNIKTVLGAIFAPKISPTFTGTVVLPSTTSIGTITNTELSYLDGVTAAIQTQLNGKQAYLGYPPVQQGTGIGQLPNSVKIGWNGDGTTLTIDDSYMGFIWSGQRTASSFSGNGYQMLPSGLIIQWGYVDFTANYQQVNFPISFPNIAAAVTLGNTFTSSGTGEVYVTTVTNSKFNLYGRPLAIDVGWIAIGY